MAAAPDLRRMLLDGHHRLSLGSVHEAIAQVIVRPRLAGKLVELLWDDEPGVVNRAVQCVELISRERPEIFQPWKAELLGLLAEAEEKKLRWSLIAILPRLQLDPMESARLAALLQGYLEDSSSIVKTNVLQGIADLAAQNPELLPLARDLLRLQGRSGTPAMRARSHNLLRKMEKNMAD